MIMNRKETLALLRQFNIRLNHSLGQNFLIDERIIGRICQVADLSPADLVIEIGPGLGSLTRELARLAGRVIAIEIDRQMLPALEQALDGFPNCQVMHADALDIDLASVTAGWTGPVKVVANLPYYITTPLIMKILGELPGCSEMVLMIQKEAADRVMARPGCKQYGPLTVLAASIGTVSRAIDVPAASFFPIPHVDSCVIRINAAGRLQISDWPAYSRFLESCFAQRRKTLINSLKSAGYGPERIARLSSRLDELELGGNARAERLTREEFLDIYHSL